MNRTLRCGCRLCGCLCPDHSPSGKEWLCAPHVDRAVFRFVFDEARRLVVIALFVAIAGAWVAILN